MKDKRENEERNELMKDIGFELAAVVPAGFAAYAGGVLTAEITYATLPIKNKNIKLGASMMAGFSVSNLIYLKATEANEEIINGYREMYELSKKKFIEKKERDNKLIEDLSKQKAELDAQMSEATSKVINVFDKAEEELKEE